MTHRVPSFNEIVQRDFKTKFQDKFVTLFLS